MKGPAKKLVQQAITNKMHKSITKIQAMYRAKVARELHAKRLNAREMIRKAAYKYFQRRKWEKEIESYAGRYTEIVIRIQKVYRWRRRWGMILDYVFKRKTCAIRIQKAYRRRRLHLLFMSVIEMRMRKRIVLQRAFKFFAMH